MDNGDQGSFEPWLGCGGYVFRRHFLQHATWSDGKLTADTRNFTTSIACGQGLQWIYELLTAMDTKASALMRLNGVMIAAAALFLGAAVFADRAILTLTKLEELFILAAAALSAASIFLCLFVVNVSWLFLGKVKETASVLDFTEELRELQTTALFRQKMYRLAWQISLVATALFAVEFIWQVLYFIYRWVTST